jgi:hypothetical protein
MRVSPLARPPNMKERWEIDLSPGMRTVPERPEDLRAVAGRALAPCDMGVFLDRQRLPGKSAGENAG